MAHSGTLTSVLEVIGCGSLRYTQFVDHQSACLHGKRAIYLNTDHSGLNKFSGPDDENFLLVGREIERMINEAPLSIGERYACTFHLLCTLDSSFFGVPLTSGKHTPCGLEK